MMNGIERAGKPSKQKKRSGTSRKQEAEASGAEIKEHGARRHETSTERSLPRYEIEK